MPLSGPAPGPVRQLLLRDTGQEEDSGLAEQPRQLLQQLQGCLVQVRFMSFKKEIQVEQAEIHKFQVYEEVAKCKAEEKEVNEPNTEEVSQYKDEEGIVIVFAYFTFSKAK